MSTLERPAQGYVNAHTHMYSGLAPLGMPAPAQPPENFVQILERVWWRLDRALDERSLRASARLYAAEALLAGTTALVDHHESPAYLEGSLDTLADACEELGIRAVLCFGATERNGGREEARRGLAECARFARSNARPRVRGLVGLHAAFTVSDGTLEECGAVCAELGVAAHVHVAEDRADVDDSRSRGYADPLDRLTARGALPPGSVLAHGVHLGEAAVRSAGERGFWLVQNPRSNEGNRVGYPGFLWASPRVALGTDGYPAQMDVEAGALERLARQHADPGLPGAVETRLAAGRVMVDACFGGPGATAGDVLEWEPARPGEPARARRAVVAGDVVVDGGRLVRGDIEGIRAEAREEAARLWRKMEAL